MGVGWEAERKTGGEHGGRGNKATLPHFHTSTQPHSHTAALPYCRKLHYFPLPHFRTNPKLLLLHYLEHLGERRLAHHEEEGCVLEESVDREAAVREHVVRGTDGGGEVRGSRAVWWC